MRHQLLRDTDWASMDHSIEIRTPFVDVELLKNVAPLLASPNRPTKRALADAPAKKLPDAILNRPKTGFQIPIREWLLAADGQLSKTTEDGGRTRQEQLRPPPSGPRAPQSFPRGLRGWARMIHTQFAAA